MGERTSAGNVMEVIDWPVGRTSGAVHTAFAASVSIVAPPEYTTTAVGSLSCAVAEPKMFPAVDVRRTVPPSKLTYDSESPACANPTPRLARFCSCTVPPLRTLTCDQKFVRHWK